MDSIVLLLEQQNECCTDDHNVLHYVLPFNSQLKWEIFKSDFGKYE